MSRLGATPDELTVHMVEDRRMVISPYGRGNAKLGPGVYTYSRLPVTTCPGSTTWCRAACYAVRAALDNPPLGGLWSVNSQSDEVPSLPADARLVRWHVSGDFDTEGYILNWIEVVEATPDVTYWGYTRSWAVPSLAAGLIYLRDLPNVQLFASVDSSTSRYVRRSLRLAHWRLADVIPDDVIGATMRHITPRTDDDVGGYVCPEETGHKNNCVDCGYCFAGKRGDVVFVEH